MKPKLLIVEDDDLHRALYERLFHDKFEPNICKTADEFCSCLSRKSYDIFMIDLSLVGTKDGIQLIKELRQNKKYIATPIFVVTANAFKRDEENAIDAGANYFVRKPIDNKRLIDEMLNSVC